MPTPEGERLSRSIMQKIGELKGISEKLDDQTASRAPSGRWSVKQILSHICGPDGIGLMPAVRLILEQDMPKIDITAEDPFFTERRSRLSVKELLSEIEKEYGAIACTVAGLKEDQMGRKAHIPLFKETPLGEYPTLATFVGALGEWHMDFHINHMKEILKELGQS